MNSNNVLTIPRSGKQKILITGANGYLGAQLSHHLAQSGHQIVALCFPEAPKEVAWCSEMEEVLVGSVADSTIIDKLGTKTFDIIIHLVSLDQQMSQEVTPEVVFDINVQPCYSLLSRFINKGLKTFIYLSTIHVYGELPKKIINEEQEFNPKNIYALTHAMCEQTCDYFNKTTDVNVISVRLSNSYGQPVFKENNCWWLAVNNLCKTAFKDKEIRLQSDGTPQRDFIHGSDVCQAITLLCENAPKNKNKNTYHISSSNTYTLLELAGIVREVYKELYHQTIPIRTPSNNNVIDHNCFTKESKYIIDNSALKKIGFHLKCDLKQGIRSLFLYLENEHIN